jgi:ribosomal protein L20
MARIKGAIMTRKRRKKVLKLAKGYFGAKSKLFKTAKEAVMKSPSTCINTLNLPSFLQQAPL